MVALHTPSRRKVLATAALTLFSGKVSSVASGEPELQWLRTYSTDTEGRFDSIIPRHESGWVAVGRRENEGGGGTNAWAVATQRDGAFVWEATPASTRLSGLDDVLRTVDGYATSGYGKEGLYLLRLGFSGNVRSLTTDEDVPLSATVTDSGLAELGEGHVVAGTLGFPEQSWTWVSAFGNDGEKRWSKQYSETYQFEFVLSNPDGGCIIGGERTGGKLEDYPWLAVLGPDGAEQSETTFSSLDRFDLRDASLTPGGEVVLLGEDTDAQEPVIAELSNESSVESVRQYSIGGHPTHIVQTGDGYTFSMNSPTRLVRTDQTARVMWLRKYLELTDHAVSALQSVEGEQAYVVAGRTTSSETSAWAAGLSTEPFTTPTTTETKIASHSQTPTTADKGAESDRTTQPVGKTQTSLPIGPVPTITGIVCGIWWMYQRAKSQ